MERVDLANWALRTARKFTTGVKHQFPSEFLTRSEIRKSQSPFAPWGSKFCRNSYLQRFINSKLWKMNINFGWIFRAWVYHSYYTKWFFLRVGTLEGNSDCVIRVERGGVRDDCNELSTLHIRDDVGEEDHSPSFRDWGGSWKTRRSNKDVIEGEGGMKWRNGLKIVMLLFFKEEVTHMFEFYFILFKTNINTA